jgi:hypothetical protein
MSAFSDWILGYYKMLLGDFIDSDLKNQISFKDLSSAFQAGRMSDVKLHRNYLLITSDDVIQVDELNAEMMELATEGRAVIIQLKGNESKQWYDSEDGSWIDVMKGYRALKEESDEQADSGTNRANKEAVQGSTKGRKAKKETPKGDGGI